MPEPLQESMREIFEDGFGTYWLSTVDCNATQAIAVVREVSGETPAGAFRVRGSIGCQAGEPYFTEDDDGPDEMWQVDTQFPEPPEWGHGPASLGPVAP